MAVVIAILLAFVCHFIGQFAEAATPTGANIAYHLLWTSADVSGVGALLRALYHADNMYLIDVIPPANFDVVSGAVRRALPPSAALRIRKVDAPVPGGVSEALTRLDGMAEFLWWPPPRSFDFYIALTPHCFPRLSPEETRTVLHKFRGTSFFRTVGAADAHDIDMVYFDAATVFSHNPKARAALIQPHVGYPDRRYRKARLVHAHRNFVASADLVRVAADSSLSLRMLSVLAHANRVVENFFASLALAAGLPIVQSTSLRCAGRDPNSNTCLFAEGEGDSDGDVSVDGILDAISKRMKDVTARRSGDLPL